MKFLFSQMKLSNLKFIALNFCEDCVYDKQKRVMFSKIGVRVKLKKLDLIYTNALGPTTVQLIVGSSYFITFMIITESYVFTFKMEI